MNEQDKPAFAEAVVGIHGYYGKDAPPPNVLAMWWGLALRSDLTIERFLDAAQQALDNEKFCPVWATIMQYVPNGYPSPEEAWNMLAKSEADAGWTFPEMDRAMGACYDSLNRGDMIAARLAFVERYKKEILGKRGQPKWRITEATVGSYDARNQAKLDLLEEHPERAPNSMTTTRAALEDFREAPKGLAAAVAALEDKTVQNEDRKSNREVARENLKKMRDILGINQTPFTLGEEA